MEVLDIHMKKKAFYNKIAFFFCFDDNFVFFQYKYKVYRCYLFIRILQ